VSETITNWSGSVRFTPARVERPADERGVVRVVEAALARGGRVRAVGACHSSSAVLETDDVVLSLERQKGVVSHDTDHGEAVLRPGTTLAEAGEALLSRGLTFHNLGDVNVQTLVGAVGTGTHGSGRTLQNLATMLIGGRLVTGTGEVLEFNEREPPGFIRAARVSLGALGVLTQVCVRLLPAYRLRRREWCVRIADCLNHIDRLADENRNLDFYWYPRSDLAKIRALDEPGRGTAALAFGELVEDREDWAPAIIAKQRDLKFEEMEYALPAEAGLACFAAIRARVKAVHRQAVAWRTLYRFVAADDALLSPAHGRATVTISLHHNAGLPYEPYFADIEPILRDHGGRPHWAKKHHMQAAGLRALYPAWDEFQAVRRRLDPHGVFLSPAMRALLEERA
jgi:FAD/FMN-containing dehydrogenase